MAGQITNHPPFKPPHQFSRARLWCQRLIPSGYTDGVQRNWPACPPYRPGPDEFWLCMLGQKWAEADGINEPDKLPDGYAMFETPQPSGPQIYKRLFGHPSGRFYDSALRFVDHFLWLMSGMEGNCECVLCHKRTTSNAPRQNQSEGVPRVPRPHLERSNANSRRPSHDSPRDDDDDDSSQGSSAAGRPLNRRGLRQVRQTGVSSAVDEEGTEDIYKDCIRKLENAKGGARGVEIDLTEEDSIDWKADRESLPNYLTQIEQQHSFIPRIGELVLWCPDFLDGHHLVIDPKSSEYKYYSFEQKCFHGFPAWRGGVVAAVPSASIKNGPIDFPDILDAPSKKTAFTTSGFRIETMPDPNDDLNKAMSKQYKYVPLKNIRPLSQWRMLLKGIAQNRMHPSIEYALTCMTSLSLLEKWRFNGDWPHARIFCKGIYLGSELITVGDTVRLLPTNPGGEIRPDVVVVESIRFNLLNMHSDHVKPDDPHLCTTSYVAFVGSAYTTSLEKIKRFRAPANKDTELPNALNSTEIKTLFRSVGADEYGQWYPWHGVNQKYEVSHERVLGRLYEADAVRLWTGNGQYHSSAGQTPRPKVDFDAESILEGRHYATISDARLDEPQSPSEINWFFADTRAQALAIATLNGIDVGNYHEIRTEATMKQWRMQVKVAAGHKITPQVEDEYIRDLSVITGYSGARRGRKPGAKLIDGKVVYPGKSRLRNDGHDDVSDQEERPKPSSQMAGAAFATDIDSTEEDLDDEVESNDISENEVQTSHSGYVTKQPKTSLSKAAIMSSVELAEDEVFDDDVSDEEDWFTRPLPARGGTEESEGGDYRE